MTDEELIARLRSQIGDDVQHVYDHEALFRISADRIEQLLNLNEALVELMDDRDAKLAKAVEALTPSGDTKAEYMGEFHFSQTMIGEDGDEVTVKTYVPWTTIKKIMAAINARATLAEIKGESHE